jgi:hypothetical protein
MELSAKEEPPERKKRTKWLLAGGAVSLLIPLAGAIYLHVRENSGAPGPSGRSDLFERRDGADLKITPTQTAVVPPSALTAPPPSGIFAAGSRAGSSSLDFIKTNDDLKSRIADSKAPGAGAPAVTAPAASTAPPVAAAPPAAVAAKKTPKGPKPFNMPKLQPTRGFSSNFGSSKAPQGAAPGGQGQQDMLKNLPAGAQNNPAVQQYLQNHPNGQ